MDYMQQFLNNCHVSILPIHRVFEFLHKYSVVIINLINNQEGGQKADSWKLRESIFNILSLFDFQIEKFEEFINLFGSNIMEKNYIINSTNEATKDFGEPEIKNNSSIIFETKEEFNHSLLCQSCFRDFQVKTELKNLKSELLIDCPTDDSFSPSPNLSRNQSFMFEAKYSIFYHTLFFEFNKRSMEKSPNELIRLNCSHSFCRECLNIYIESYSESSKKMYTIKCPDGECKCILSFHSIVKIISNYPLKIQLANQIASKLKHSPEIDSFLCKQPDCNSLLLKQPQMGVLIKKTISCYCQDEKCILCGDLAHAPLTCREYKQWVNNYKSKREKLNQRWMRENTKACPRCGLAIGRRTSL